MKLETTVQKLKEAIGLIDRVAAKHMTLPVLSCVVIETGKNSVIFKATNLDIGVEVSLPAKTSEAGTIAVPASIISSLVSQLPNQSESVTLSVASGNLTITSSKSHGVIKTMPPEDFPSIPRVVDGQEISLPTNLLIKGLTSVWYSASISGVKPELSSVYVYRNNDFITCVATDSFRLAEKKMSVPSAVTMNDILIPFKNVSEIVRLLEKMGDNVKVRLGKNLISFEAGGVYAVSRVIDGVFPDYKQIIPKSFTTEVVALKQDFLNALKISNIFSDKFNQVHISIDPKKKLFEVQTKNSDVGENKTAVDAAITGDPIEINFNYKYIVDCFQSIDADSISLQLSGMNRPMVIRPVSGDQTFMYLVMPMNR
jgi:DNA polymerase-3 subunit beta